MKQQTLSDMEYDCRRKETKREEFLDIMDEVIPWDEWISVIRPYYFIFQMELFLQRLLKPFCSPPQNMALGKNLFTLLLLCANILVEEHTVRGGDRDAETGKQGAQYGAL